jgi:putative membrane protein
VLVLLTLPFTILTLGLFLLLLNAAMLNLAGWFVDGFEVVGFWSAVFGAIVVSLVSGLCSQFIGPKGSYEVMVVRRAG